ncbi:MAG: MFS transporter [Corynebacteriales bacterium]|nr:MFS transporter [Mycobacteriales bacterium]
MARTTNRWIVLSVLCLALFVVALDATVLYVALPALTEDMQPTAVEALWIVDTYSLVIAGVLLTTGTLADRFGRDRMLIAGFAVFGAASAAVAFAPNPAVLIGARALLGVGGAMIMPPTLSIIRDVFTNPRERSTAVGIWSSVAAGGAAVGPIIGGFLLEHYWWGSVFLINVPVMAVGIVLGWWLLPRSRDPHPGRWDAPSALISLVGILGVVYGVKKVGYYGLFDPRVFVPLILGALLLVWFVRRQLRLPTPLLDMSLFTQRAFSTAAGCAILATFGLVGVEMFLAQYFQYVLGDSPLEAGFRLLPAMLAAMLSAPLTGAIIHRYGPRAAVVLGFAAISMSFALFSYEGRDASGWLIAFILVGMGSGAAVALTASSDTIITVAPRAKAGAAAAVDETSYELGIGLGVAVLGSLMSELYSNRLGDVPGVSGEDLDDAQESIGNAAHVADSLPARLADPLMSAAQEAFTSSLMTTMAASAAILALAALLAGVLFPRK